MRHSIVANLTLACRVMLVACCGLADAAEADAGRPNILLICVDDLRPELGCYGADHVLSPNIDALSRSGVTFDRCYVQVAVCNPSRASMMTGIRPDRLGTWTLRVHFRESMPDAVTIPQHLRQHGYTAEGYGKIFHNPWPDFRSWDQPHRWGDGDYTNYSSEQRAFTKSVEEKLPKDDWRKGNLRGPIANAPDIDDSEHSEGGLTRLAIERLSTLGDGDKPFFLAVGYTLPHLPWTPPKKWWDKYDRASLPLANNPYPPRNAPEIAIGTNYELSHYADMIDMPTPYEPSLPESEIRRLKHAYYASISFIDSEIGKLLQALDSEGRAEDTIVVLWSDHGYKLGEHNAWGKMTNFEIDTRVPLIIRDPRASANGQRCNALVETLDLYPTLCDLAGVDVPGDLDGKSFSTLLSDPSSPHKQAAFSQYIRQGKIGNSIRTDAWRYVEWRPFDGGPVEHRELYDEINDPDENTNVVGDHAAIEEELRRQLHEVLVPHEISLVPQIHSERGGEKVELTWINEHDGRVRVTWITPGGERKNTFEIASGASRRTSSFVGHVFSIESLDGRYSDLVSIESGENTLRLSAN